MADISLEYRKRLLKRQLEFERKYKGVFDDIAKQFAALANDPNAKFSKAFRFPPQLTKRMAGLMSDFHDDMLELTEQEITEAWGLSNTKNDKIVTDYLKTITTIKTAQRAAYFLPNTSALEAFISGKHGPMTLSESVWKITSLFRAELEVHLGIGIANGDSAQVISRRIRQYLNNPDTLFRRVRDKQGRLIPSARMLDYHPGQGTYRSSYKNAMRLARTNTNRAYLLSDNLRWQQLDMVKGVKISLSAQHPEYNFPEICEVCEGIYPKDFIWQGWHPSCYSDDTEVLTVNGWKLFSDVDCGDKVLSLNRETKNIEIAEIITSFSYWHEGNMVRYFNRGLDLLVTEDHNMIYLSKSIKGLFKETTASQYSATKGGLYRSSEWIGNEVDSIKIGEYRIDFDLFCEFMGYYLADGSVSFTKKHEFNVSQRYDHDIKTRAKIKACMQKLPLNFWEAKAGFGSTDAHFRTYLEQFGKSLDKYIPQEIKDSSTRQIKIFLDAFICCDGMIRKPRSFMGNRGIKFIPKSEDRNYTTSSNRMASDLGELILKIGKRPSYAKSQPHAIKFNNGIYNVSPNWKIAECQGGTATVFKREVVKYTGFVRDVEIDKNHTLYVRRKGKCVWSSNCLCHATPVLSSEEDFLKYLDTGIRERNRMVTQYPQGFKNFVRDNYERFMGYKSIPYWMDDNLNIINDIVKKQ